MTGADELKALLGIFIGSLPTLLAGLVAIIIIVVQGWRAPSAVPWALSGFGLAMVISIVGRFGQVLLQSWVIHTARSFKESSWMFGTLGVVNSTLHGVALILLLAAVLAGRPPAAIPPPKPRG